MKTAAHNHDVKNHHDNDPDSLYQPNVLNYEPDESEEQSYRPPNEAYEASDQRESS